MKSEFELAHSGLALTLNLSECRVHVGQVRELHRGSQH